jgi:hypothetical protein
MLLSQLHQPLHDRWIGLVGNALWRPRFVLQPGWAFLFVAVPDLVAGLSANAELAAQVRHAFTLLKA